MTITRVVTWGLSYSSARQTSIFKVKHKNQPGRPKPSLGDLEGANQPVFLNTPNCFVSVFIVTLPQERYQKSKSSLERHLLQVDKKVSFDYTPTQIMAADYLTKPCPTPKFKSCLKQIGMPAIIPRHYFAWWESGDWITM